MGWERRSCDKVGCGEYPISLLKPLSPGMGDVWGDVKENNNGNVPLDILHEILGKSICRYPTPTPKTSRFDTKNCDEVAVPVIHELLAKLGNLENYRLLKFCSEQVPTWRFAQEFGDHFQTILGTAQMPKQIRIYV